MADNARDQDFNLEAEPANVGQNDPLLELAELMGGAPRAAAQPRAPEERAPVEAAPPPITARAEAAAPLPEIGSPEIGGDDLEAQLMAELGMGAPTAGFLEEPAAIEPPLPVQEPRLDEPFEQEMLEPEPVVEPSAHNAPPVSMSIEDELAALLDAEPSQPLAANAAAPIVAAPVEPVPTFEPAPVEPVVETRATLNSPQDDFAAASDFDDNRRDASEPETIVDALDTDLDDYMFVDFDDLDDKRTEPADAVELQKAPPPFTVEDAAPMAEPVTAADIDLNVGLERGAMADDLPATDTDAPVSEAFFDDVFAADLEPVAETPPVYTPPAAPSETMVEATPVVDDEPLFDAVADEDLVDDHLFDGFDDELNDEFNALFDDEAPAPAEPATPVDAPDAPEETMDVGSFAAPAAVAAAGVAGVAAMTATKAKGDDLLDHIGFNDANSTSALDELDAIMNEPAPRKAAMPDVQTTDVDALDDDIFADFEVPELPQEAAPERPQAASSAGYGVDDLDFDLDIEGELNATETARAAPSAPAEFDDDFATDDFEAVLARDMEYASHARATPVVEDDEFFDEGLEEDMPAAAAPPPAKKRGFLVAGLVAAVAIAGAIGVFAMTGGGSDPSLGPVTVEADPSPIKVEPDEPGGSNVPNQDRALFSGDNGTVAPNQPQLVTTSEEPVDIATAPGAELPSAVAAKDDERLLPDADGAVTANEPVTSVSARRVRTLVVRPDGTLVEQPLEEPAAAQPAIVAQAPVEPAEDAAAVETPASEENAAVTFTPPAATPAAPVVTTQVPVRTVETRTIVPPIVADRPNDQPVNIVNPQPQADTQVALAPQPQAPAPAAAPSAASSPFAVQIASVPSRDGAQQSAVNLQQRFSNVLGGRGISIQEAQIEGRGTFYRVRVGAESREDANALCTRYQRAGGSCFVTR